MPWDELTIDTDDHTGWIVLRRATGASDHARGAFPAPRWLARENLVAALTATPWTTMRGGRLIIDGEIACRRLAAMIEDMVSCFTRDGRPDARLEQVRSHLADEFAEALKLERVSWWHCAWLDVAVREDAADLARSGRDLWRSDALTIELDAIRRRRVEKLAERIAGAAAAKDAASRRLASSARSRESRAKGKRKSG
jgi:hypothetical protein